MKTNQQHTTKSYYVYAIVVISSIFVHVIFFFMVEALNWAENSNESFAIDSISVTLQVKQQLNKVDNRQRNESKLIDTPSAVSGLEVPLNNTKYQNTLIFPVNPSTSSEPLTKNSNLLNRALNSIREQTSATRLNHDIKNELFDKRFEKSLRAVKRSNSVIRMQPETIQHYRLDATRSVIQVGNHGCFEIHQEDRIGGDNETWYFSDRCYKKDRKIALKTFISK